MDAKTYQDYIEEIDLQRYWLVLKRRWPIALLVFLACLSGAALFIFTRESIYEATGKLLIRPDRSTSLTGVGSEIGSLESVTRGSPLATQEAVVRSTPVLQAAIDELQLTNEDGTPMAPRQLQKQLSVSPMGGADVLSVSYQADNPEVPVEVVNAVMAAYIQRSITTNRIEATTAREFVQKQLPNAKLEFERATEALRQFKAQNGVIALENEASTAVGVIASLDDQISQTSAQLANLDTQVNALLRQLGLSAEQAKRVEALSQSPGVQQALEELQTTQAELAQQGSLYRPNHPIMVNLERRRDSLQALLDQRVDEVLGSDVAANPSELQMSPLRQSLTSQLVGVQVERLGLTSQLQDLEAARNQYLDRAEAFPRLEKRQLELQQTLNAAQNNYEALLLRLQEAQLAENQTVGSAEILELAQPPEDPISNSFNKLLIAAAGAGVLLGIACAFFLDLIDKSIKTAKDGEALLGYTLLGLIPKFSLTPEESPALADPAFAHAYPEGVSSRVVAFGHSQPMAAAAYQMLQANLKFTSSDTPHRVITVTSSVAAEGKSEVCANLAASLAQAGKHVLLIDADMRSPSQHHLWGVVNRIGLSQVLVREEPETDALQTIAPHLTLMTAGALPPNPLAILDSERMATLLKQLADRYDYVLLDTPPLLGAVDAAVLGKVSDGVLFVFRPRVVDAGSALAAKSLLTRSGAEVLGLVANGVNIHNEHDDYVSHIKAGHYNYGRPVQSQLAGG